MILIQTLYFALPGMVANMMPVIVRRHFKFLAVPVDLNRRLWGQPVFGAHKTYRGFVFGILGAVLIAFMQLQLYERGLLQSWAYIDYSRISFLCLGGLLGFGALFADLVKSFIKRRMKLKDGGRWFPWDQLDYVVGIIAFSMFIKPMTPVMIVILLCMGPLLSIVVTRIGHLLKVRNEKW